MKKKNLVTVISSLLITSSLTLVGCESSSNSSYTPSSPPSNETSSQTETVSNSCRLTQAVSSMINQLRNQGNYVVIEYAKTLYLDATTDPNCNGEAQSLKGVLRPVWQQFVNSNATSVYTSCITACSFSNDSECYSGCEDERNNSINSESENIRNFFASN